MGRFCVYKHLNFHKYFYTYSNLEVDGLFLIELKPKNMQNTLVSPNFLILLLAALIPMVMGFIWYNPKVMGTAWMNATGLTDEKMKGGNMPVIFGVSFLLSFFLAFGLQFIVIHQYGAQSSMMIDKSITDPASELGSYFANYMAKYGNTFRTFKHGALHGTMTGIFLALPILGTNALFEKKGFKYIMINVGYWTITMALMGGIICAYA
jgi:hypothetical protein